ncbi:MAG: SGNH/GDSL hydrolase family protein [Humidesulfovibrio sp.]|nr:SGNH/GDSL hydrolase family protein [Humidesulfovibrio sp.]
MAIDGVTLHEPRGFGYFLILKQQRNLFLKAVSDDDSGKNQSKAVLMENERPLGPAHEPDTVVQQHGQGRFNHWKDQFCFSTSDNSDPRSNGSAYRIILNTKPTLAGNAAMVLTAVALYVLLLAVRKGALGAASLLEVRLGTALTNCGIVLAISTALLLGLEFTARKLIKEPDLYAHYQPGQYFKFNPYTMMVNEGPLDAKGVWKDSVNNATIPFSVKSNKLGFRAPIDFDTVNVRPKEPNEKVILIFGGSAVYGFGNTSNGTTVAGWLERILNARPNRKYKYTVFNMGNGGWVSYQEFLALDLYGRNLQPDIIIAMDGRNDVYTSWLDEGEPIGVHFSSAQMRNLIDGYYYHQERVDFFRSGFENLLLKKSEIYRLLTGKRPIEPTSVFTKTPRTFADVDKTVRFYVHAQGAMLRCMPKTRFILSAQPVYLPGYSRLDKTGIQEALAKHKDKPLRQMAAAPSFLVNYGMSLVIQETKALCDKEPNRCQFDDVHMTDAGNELVAKAYAARIE